MYSLHRNYLNLCCLVVALVSTAFCLVYFLSKKDQVEHTFSPIQKLLMKLKPEHQDIYRETFFYMTSRISSSHNYHKKIYCSSVYFTVYIYYCELEQETDDLESRKTWRQLELHVSPTRANSHEKKRSVGKELWPSVVLTEVSTTQLKVIADALIHSHTYPIGYAHCCLVHKALLATATASIWSFAGHSVVYKICFTLYLSGQSAPIWTYLCNVEFLEM
jgi:hypothetical protein